MKNREIIRQGEVLLVRIAKLPKGLTEKSKVLAEGETTGHRHRFESEQALVFADSEGNQFVRTKHPAKLIHEEHQELQIPKGVFKVVLQREFDLVSDQIKQVLD